MTDRETHSGSCSNQTEGAVEIINVDRLEQALFHAVILTAASDTEEDDRKDKDIDESEEGFLAITYPVQAEAILLHCQRPAVSLVKEPRSRSLLGLQEVGVQRVAVTIQTLSSRSSMATDYTSNADLISRSWTRQKRSEDGIQQQLPLQQQQPALDPEAPAYLDWIDFRNPSQHNEDDSLVIVSNLQRPAFIYRFLHTMLGTHHTASPWYNQHHPSRQSFHDCLVLVLPKAPDALKQFRVSDAAPSWYLHTIMECDSDMLPSKRPWETSQTDDDADDDNNNQDDFVTSTCDVLVYRYLPPRRHLTERHPETSEPASPGTLWETIPDPNKSSLSPDPSQCQCQSPSHPHPLITRLVSQPYLDALEEYPILQVLLDDLSIIQQEALAIQHWTAWPEETHYSKLNNLSETATPWTVFPLCHCFPATDATQLQWIGPTTARVPHTTRLLKQLAPYLRTALFSRLEPGALLQAHTGWQDLANHVIRVHLPLVCPEEDEEDPLFHQPSLPYCGLWVDGCVERLHVGQLQAFDDSKVHWAFNYSPTQERIVLILDMVRPKDLPEGTAIGGHSEELDAFIETMG